MTDVQKEALLVASSVLRLVSLMGTTMDEQMVAALVERRGVVSVVGLVERRDVVLAASTVAMWVVWMAVMSVVLLVAMLVQ